MKSHPSPTVLFPQENRPESKRKPRVLIVSQRRYYMPIFRCGAFEFEDMICALDDGDLLLPSRGESFKERLLARIESHVNLRIQTRPRLEIPKIDRDYDMLFVDVGMADQLVALEPIYDMLREHCRIAVCYIEEMWARDLPDDRCMRQLEKFDQILLGCSGTCEALSRAIRKNVIHLPFGIDMERFCPYPNSPRRTIDVYSMGRASDDVHRALLDWAERTGSTYLYDTICGGPFVMNVERHRKFTAHMIKRSRYFIVNPAKFDVPEETGGQIEVGRRYYEGAGGGAVLIGRRPECALFNQHFDWPDAVIEMPRGALDFMECLHHLDVQWERVEQIHRTNVVNCLRRHDWVYRWNYILKQIGMEPSPQSLLRERRMQALADAISLRPSTTEWLDVC